MFDINWSEFLIIAVVALIVVGPKELPGLMRTLGRYAGMVRRQAAEFRSHFDDAMREAEMASLREEMEDVRRQAMKSAREVESAAKADVGSSIEGAAKPPPEGPAAESPSADKGASETSAAGGKA